jgi:glycosyltransferase involved in cell wall biosynthesis
MTGSERIRVLRIISRLNIGGPAVHVAMLGRPALAGRFDSMLVTGVENAGEGSMIDLVTAQGAAPIVISEIADSASLTWRDTVALWKIVRVIRRYRPQIIETHTAKAGLLGRLAGLLTRTPVRIHTFHGHVLHGYYSPATNAMLRWLERALARTTTRIIAVSDRVRTELVEYGVAPAGKIAVVPLGLDLSPFLDADRLRGQFRAELGFPADDLLVGIVGRIFAVKNHALFVDAAVRVLRDVPNVRFVIVGDGMLRADIEAQIARAGVGGRVIITGWRRDLPAVYASLDLLAVTSNNEGTPFAAIEAMAAGVPVVATNVGGMPDLVRHDVTGVLVPPRDAEAMSRALTGLLLDAGRRRQLGAAARASALERFEVGRMVRDTHDVYEACLTSRGLG